MKKNVAQVLDEVADTLEIKGRCQGSLQDENNRVCLVEAFRQVLNIDDFLFDKITYDEGYQRVAGSDAGRYLIRIIRDINNDYHVVSSQNVLWNFNDSTDDDDRVLRVVRGAAKQWWENQ